MLRRQQPALASLGIDVEISKPGKHGVNVEIKKRGGELGELGELGEHGLGLFQPERKVLLASSAAKNTERF